MIKRKRLGQHFLTSQSIVSDIIRAADITRNDVVLEIGTGSGILVSRLCENAKKVISVDIDKTLYDDARQNLAFDNLDLVHGNGFEIKTDFTVLVSNLPYSQSRTAIEWLSQKKMRHAVIMVQKEFYEKLVQQKHAVAVIANHCFEIQRVASVGRNNFSPPPRVDSVVVKLVQKNTLSKEVIKTMNLLFSYRRKTLSNILGRFGVHSDSALRLDDLKGDEIIQTAKQISCR